MSQGLGVDDQRIAVESAGGPSGPSRGVLLAGAVVLAGVVVFLATSDFTGADEAAQSTTTSLVTTSVASTTTTVLEAAVVDEALRSASYSPADLAAAGVEWRPVSSPDGMDHIAEVGRFRDQVVAVGGPMGRDGTIAPLQLVAWSEFDVWFQVGTITTRAVTVELTVIDPDHVLVVARTRPSLEQPRGQLFLYTSTDGIVFEESALLAADIDVLSAGHARGTTWIFGVRDGQQREEVIRALPQTIAELIVGGSATMYYQDESAIVVAPMNVEIGRYPLGDLLPGRNPALPFSPEPVTWALGEAGGVRAAGVPFDGAFAAHVRRTELGDLVAQVYVPEPEAYHEWLSVDGETWREFMVWERVRGEALGGVGSRSLYAGSSFSPSVVVIENGVPSLLTFTVPGHEINTAKSSTASSAHGALLSTGRFGGLDLTADVVVEREGFSLTVTSTGVASVSTAQGEEVITAALSHLIELGFIDTAERRVHLGDVDGTVLMHVTFDELAELEATRARRASTVGLLLSQDLETWSFSELPIGGEVVAADVGPDLAMVVVDDGIAPWVWVAEP